jgi:hypothetical protein
MASSSNEEDAQWRAKWLLRLPWMTVNSMIDKADRPVYKSLCELNNDAALTVHNITIFFRITIFRSIFRTTYVKRRVD